MKSHLVPTDLALLRSLRLGCVGSGGTGKSTFALRVHEDYGVPVVSEGVREWLARRGKRSPGELDPAEASDFQWHILEHRDRNTVRGPFVADRTALDSICFA